MTFDMAGEAALEAFLAEHEPGGIIYYPAFTSASTKSDGYPIDGELTVTLIIQSESGRNLDGHGNNIEQEIVFKRKSRFLVERTEIGMDGKPIIYMREVKARGEVVAGGETHGGRDGVGLPRGDGAGSALEGRDGAV